VVSIIALCTFVNDITDVEIGHIFSTVLEHVVRGHKGAKEGLRQYIET